MTASASSTTRSRICGLETPALLLLPLLIGLCLAACNGKDKESPSEERDYALEIHRCATRLKAVSDRREALQGQIFLKKTAVGEILALMVGQETAAANTIRVLTDYHKNARDQGVSNAEQLTRNGKPLEQLGLRVGQLEQMLNTVDRWLAEGGNDLSATWTMLIMTNRLSKALVEAGIADSERLALLRDHSARLKDARRYWTGELANAIRGAEIDQQLLRLATGTRDALHEEIAGIHALYQRADMDMKALLNATGAIDARLKWAAQTLERAPQNDAWRQRAAGLLKEFAQQAETYRSACKLESHRVLDRSTEARGKRDDTVRNGAVLLDRINKVFVVEAEKRGWPLPVKP